MKNLETTIKVASATIFTFYLKMHHFHFNVTGPNFFEYHKMSQKIYEDVWESFDTISEQIRALDMIAPAGLHEFGSLSVIQDAVGVADAHSMLHELLLDNDRLIQVLQEVETLAVNHPGLRNFIEGRIDAHEKYGWFLRATVSGR